MLQPNSKVPREEGLRYVDVGNVPGHPWEHTYCPECHNIANKRHGFDITGWNLDENNRCANCSYKLPIIGGLSSEYQKKDFCQSSTDLSGLYRLAGHSPRTPRGKGMLFYIVGFARLCCIRIIWDRGHNQNA